MKIMAPAFIIGLAGLAVYAATTFGGDEPAPDPSPSKVSSSEQRQAKPGDQQQESLSSLIDSSGPGDISSKLDALLSKKIPASYGMIDQISQRFKGSTDAEEKLRLARFYNSAYFNTEDKQLREKISTTLTELIRSETDPKVGRSLALSHSRLLFDGNTLENLSTSYKKKFLSFDDYYGELAHAFPGAPPEIRTSMIKELAEGHNRYASDIVADYMSGGNSGDLTAAEIGALKGFLKTNEPIFSGAPASFSMFEAIRVEKWLGAMAEFEKNGPAAKPNYQAVFDKIQMADTDPRFAIAFLISGRGRELATDKTYTAEILKARSKAYDFIDKNSSSQSLQSVRTMLDDIKP
ncbi:hypothetical protein HNP48_001691 [Acidovorax soli]|uniref:DUF2059 domain-containing protein n=1 Tax=Acidovorax soli TaxID=592050 RepID=A0A7X0PCG9_9BURK|nr:hypothetical protein [Acidovorax soli]MBB6559027.1 hypothetical protein [Acidovorax soli]